MSKKEKKSRTPMSSQLKRALIILGVMIGVGFAAIFFLSQMQQSMNEPVERISSLGGTPSGQRVTEVELSQATKERLERVQSQEAQQARQQRQTYIPETFISGREPIIIDVQEPVRQEVRQVAERAAQDAPPPTGPTQQAARQSQAVARAQHDQYMREREMAMAGLERQLNAVLAGLGPATAVDVALLVNRGQDQSGQGGASGDGQGQLDANQVGGDVLVGGDEIVAAILTTPIDTDRTNFVMAEISAGRLKGATLRGNVRPMNMSGDIEDVGIQFTSMRLPDGRFYQIDALALNEQTATDAMEGRVDRRVFSRTVMPILMAGLSGVSTYFTVRGTPSTSVATGVDTTGTGAIIVDQERASRRDARDQGIGDAIDKTVEKADRAVARAESRPNQVTVDAFTPIGVIFNQPVYQNTYAH